ncbi:MAG: Uma2 family endonuclease [Ardenticatenia bacterium]|nr:Uma2 family endonuclease [Ardenticatenia bacterium]
MTRARTAAQEGVRRLHMSYEEFLAWSGEDTHAEWEDGEVIVFMPPKDRHQDLVRFLAVLMDLFVQFYGLGTVRFAPFEMRLSPKGPSREPDILFVAAEHAGRLTEERLEGPADLVVEVVSEESVTRDRVKKFREYQEAGVREYWVIDSRPGQSGADFWVLEGGSYRAGEVDEVGVYRSSVLPGFWLRLEWLQAERLPDTLACFAEMVGFPPDVVETLRALAARGPAKHGEAD